MPFLPGGGYPVAMPSTLVHLGFACLVAAALLADDFDERALAVVLGVVLLPELDTFLGLWFAGAHRAYLHNVWVVLVPVALLLWDVRLRARSAVRGRWGRRGVRVAWVALLALAATQILLDAFYNGVNLLWPLHDAFVDLSGRAYLSDREGFVQTFIEVGDPERSVRGTTDDVHYRTGVDPAPPGESAADAERRFMLAETGPLFLLMVTGYVAAGIRLRRARRGAT